VISPDGWPEVGLDQLIEPLQSGSRPRGGVRQITHGIPSVGGEHLTSRGTFDFSKTKYVPQEFFDSMRRGRIRTGDVLIVKDGATTGKVALVRDDFPFDQAVVNEHVFICRPKRDVVPGYLFWFLFSGEGQRRILEHFQGSAQGGINQSFAAGTHIPLAPYESQGAIVELLQVAAAKATSAGRHLGAGRVVIGRFQDAVITAGCSGRLTADWRESHAAIKSADRLLAKIQEKREEHFEAERSAAKAEGRRATWSAPVVLEPPSADETKRKPDLPGTWLYCRLGNLAEVVRGSSPRPAGDPRYFGGDIPWITVAELTKDESVYLTNVQNFVTQAGRSRSRWINPGTLLLTNSGATLGVPKITKIGGCINDGSVALVDIPLSSQLYLYYFLKSQTRNLRAINQGAAQPNLNTDIVKNIVTPLPPLAEQAEIVRRVEGLLAVAETLMQRLDSASEGIERSSQAVLAKAFHGELNEVTER
jgi:type I restriction enzyme S subunit